MQSPEALAAALALLQDPRLARFARRSPLPKGVTFLLEAAVGETGALAAATAVTGRSEVTLSKAAGFFIEQVLLSRQADSYRILGADPGTPAAELRRNMALLMRWLHPDVLANGAPGERFDRSAYASRVTKAWESIKTPERRAAYEVSCDAARGRALIRGNPPASGRAGEPNLKRWRRREVYRPKREGFWNRLLLLLAGRK